MMIGKPQVKQKNVVCELCGAQIVTDTAQQSSKFTYPLCSSCKEQAILNL